MDYLAELDRMIAEADDAALALPGSPEAASGERVVRHLIATGAIKDNVDLAAFYKATVDKHYERFQVRQEHANRLIERLRQGVTDERARAALADQLRRLEDEMQEMASALEDIANYG